MRRVLSVLLLCAAPVVAEPARGPDGVVDIGAALRGGRWAEAAAGAARERDPLAGELVRFFRLLTAGGGGSAEIAGFMAEHPEWPLQAQLARRLNEALAVDGDDHGVMTVCARLDAPAALRCAELPRRVPDPVADARRGWLAGTIADAAGEMAFLARFGRTVTPDEQWQRFERLAWTDNGAVGGAAARQAARLDPVRRVLALARLALRRDEPAVVAPEWEAGDPGLVLDEARTLRRQNQDQAALAVWLRAGAAAEAGAPAERRGLFWDERNLLARRLLRAGDAAGAYALVSGQEGAGEAMLDAEFLAGWIALRRLNRPTEAAAHFSRLLDASRAAITQARGHYWLGRVRSAQEDPAGAQTEFALAAGWPTTFYGQAAARVLGDLPARLAGLRDPGWDVADVALLAGHDLSRAALLLASWNEGRRGRLFLLRLEEVAPGPAFRALNARLAAELGWPDAAVGAARRAGRDGIMLPGAGWPLPFSPPPGPPPGVEAAFALGVMRQESGFDPDAASPVGARGLMQLMPATALAVARRIGDAGSAAALRDPAANMRLGVAYLAGLLEQFGGALPLAAAGYNAGPSRGDGLAGGERRPAWRDGGGDGGLGGADPVRRNAQLRAAGDGEHGDLPGANGDGAEWMSVAWVCRAVASVGGVGFVRRGPGTAGSAVAVLAGVVLVWWGGAWALAAGLVVAAVGGWWAIGRAVADRDADPGWVVVDEVAGQWLAMLAVPWGTETAWAWVAGSFLLFRVFDIAKKGPVGWADRQGGAFGIMADDVLAGVAAATVLLGLRWVLGTG